MHQIFNKSQRAAGSSECREGLGYMAALTVLCGQAMQLKA